METISNELAQDNATNVSLQDTVKRVITHYLRTTKNLKGNDLHKMFLSEVEPPLYQALMEHTRYNQSKAAEILGLSRGTMRKRLELYFGPKYFPQLQDELDDLDES